MGDGTSTQLNYAVIECHKKAKSGWIFSPESADSVSHSPVVFVLLDRTFLRPVPAAEVNAVLTSAEDLP